MKQVLLFLLLALTTQLFAQQAGVVSYKEEIPNPKAKEIREQMKAKGFQVDIPDVTINNRNLYFTDNESIYKAKPKKEDDYKGREIGGKSIKISFGSSTGQNGYYREISSNNYLQEKDIMGKKFLIEDTEPTYQWKITGKTEQLGQYQVMEATTTNGDDVIQAWFTPQIPVSTGPAEFAQLPGLILRVNINQGERLIYATNIDLRSLTDEENIQQPTIGKKTTKKKFEELQKEKLKELEQLYGKERGAKIMKF